MKKKIKKILSKNNVRNLLQTFAPFLKFCIGSYYVAIHCVVAIFVAFILLFSNNILFLIIIANIIALMGLASVILHNCPITQLECKYLGFSASEIRQECLQNIGIFYNCGVYEFQLEVLLNLFMLTVFKIFVIIILFMFFKKKII